MRAMESQSPWGRAAGLALGVSALFFTFACNGSRDLPAASAQSFTANQAGAPIVVSCEPHQRTLVRPTVVNGAAVSQVECVSAAPVAGSAPVQPVGYAPAGALSTPVTYAPQVVAAPRRVSQPVYSDEGDARIVPATSGNVRRTSQTVYDERPVKRTRSVKKSAVIVGSSAGVGAGVGAAMGGKKGALIGAAIGGGGAAVWDQITRRN
jgi:hypothetical protein